MTVGADVIHNLHDEEIGLLNRLREVRRAKRKQERPTLSVGNRVADAVAATVGSWWFIIIQSVLLVIWMALNVTAYVYQWDPYPFILLNLALSFQAAYTAPMLMMSQNRQAMIDREHAEHDYEINIKAELEIELVHQKIDQLRETEVMSLIETVRELQAELRALIEEPLPRGSLGSVRISGWKCRRCTRKRVYQCRFIIIHVEHSCASTGKHVIFSARYGLSIPSFGVGMSEELEKLINKALLRWRAREISLHFHGRKKFGVVWIARAYLDHSAVPARLAQSGAGGIVTMEKLAEFADRPIAQGLGNTAVEAVKAMTEQNWSSR